MGWQSILWCCKYRGRWERALHSWRWICPVFVYLGGSRKFLTASLLSLLLFVCMAKNPDVIYWLTLAASPALPTAPPLHLALGCATLHRSLPHELEACVDFSCATSKSVFFSVLGSVFHGLCSTELLAVLQTVPAVWSCWQFCCVRGFPASVLLWLFPAPVALPRCCLAWERAFPLP